jgi:hypothetical protein
LFYNVQRIDVAKSLVGPIGFGCPWSADGAEDFAVDLKFYSAEGLIGKA